MGRMSLWSGRPLHAERGTNGRRGAQLVTFAPLHLLPRAQGGGWLRLCASVVRRAAVSGRDGQTGVGWEPSIMDGNTHRFRMRRTGREPFNLVD